MDSNCVAVIRFLALSLCRMITFYIHVVWILRLCRNATDGKTWRIYDFVVITTGRARLVQEDLSYSCIIIVALIICIITFITICICFRYIKCIIYQPVLFNGGYCLFNGRPKAYFNEWQDIAGRVPIIIVSFTKAHISSQRLMSQETILQKRRH